MNSFSSPTTSTSSSISDTFESYRHCFNPKISSNALSKEPNKTTTPSKISSKPTARTNKPCQSNNSIHCLNSSESISRKKISSQPSEPGPAPTEIKLNTNNSSMSSKTYSDSKALSKPSKKTKANQ